MAKDVRLFRILVSSPGDVVEERRVLDEVVERVNATDGQVNSVRLELFRWEKDVAPQISGGPGGPQEIVESQIPDYDIYLGIMASRFGTPTEKFGSGTEAEFRAALEKHQHSKDGPWIMFFFKEGGPAPQTLVEVDQYRKVLEFQEQLKPLGIIGKYTTLRGSNTAFFDKVEHYLRLVIQKLAYRTRPQEVVPAPLRPAGAQPPIPTKSEQDQEASENRQFRKVEPPTNVDERAELVARALPEVFDVITPCYLLDENFFFLDWNIAFDELIAKPMGLARDDHALDFVRKLANCGEVIEHSKATFGAGRENPLVDVERLHFESPKYGLIEFVKIAAQLTDDRGGLLAWVVNLNVALAEKNDQLREDLTRTLKEKLNWTRYAYSYDKLLLPFDDYHALVKLVVSKVGDARRCVDLGAGTGNGTLELLRSDPKRIVWAIESNESMLRCLRRKVATRGERYDGHLIQIKDDIVTLNSLHEDKNEFFDAAILINVLYSVDDPVACLKQAARILKPGGILALSTSHKDTDVDALFRRMKEVLKLKGKYEGLRRNYQAAGDVHRRMEARIHRDSKEMIEGYLDSAGFDIAEWHDREYVGAVFVVKAIKRRSHDEDSWPSLHETPTPDAQVPLSYN